MARAPTRPGNNSQNQPWGFASALPAVSPRSRANQADAPAASSINTSAATYIPVEGPIVIRTTKYRQDVSPTPSPAPKDSFNVRSAHAGLQLGRKVLETR